MSRTPRTISFPVLYHVGTMDASDKRNDSYEGAGLSVSLHPTAWRGIARGFVAGPCWSLVNPKARLLDAHRMGRTSRDRAIAWAVERGYAAPCDVWIWTYHDDDLDQQVVQTFAGQDEAEVEREYGGMGTIRRRAGHRSLSPLDAATLQSSPTIGTAQVVDAVLPLWARSALGLDGVWWEDRLDPLALSAPRGVIDAGSLADWSITRLDEDPDEPDDLDECDGDE